MNFVRRRLPRLYVRLVTFHEFAFERHLLLTNTAICAASNCLADVVVQRASGRRFLPQPADPPDRRFEWRRTGRLGAVGAVLGPVCHSWYIWLDRWFVGRSWPAVLKKVAMDTGVFSPLYILAYHAVLSALEAQSGKELVKMLATSGSALLTVEWATAPCQILNFLFVPIRFRVLFDNALSFSLDMIYSHFVHADFDE